MSNLSNTGTTSTRNGESFRNNPDRFFHVMTQGWFLFTREGLQGPFLDRLSAEGFLNTHLSETQGEIDPAASWRL